MRKGGFLYIFSNQTFRADKHEDKEGKDNRPSHIPVRGRGLRCYHAPYSAQPRQKCQTASVGISVEAKERLKEDRTRHKPQYT